MSRVKVHFLAEDLLVEAPTGTPLADIATAAGADLTFGCRSGSCGTCRVRLAGEPGACSPPTAEERDYLAGLQAPPEERLACQVRVLGDLAVDVLGV